MKLRISFFLSLLITLPVLSQPPIEGDIQEMEVIGQQELTALRNKISEAEDRMYDIFNEYNKDDRFDIVCLMEARLGTRIPQKVCRPRFLNDAESDNGKAYLATAQGSGYSGNRAPPSNAVLDREMPVMEAKLKQAVLENPAFYEVVVEHHELREQYEQRISTYWGNDE
jgi:hypothetical protein